MEVPLPLQKPLSCRAVFNVRTHLKIRPFLGFLSHGTTSLSSQSSLWSKDLVVAHISHQITASADFSRRRQRRKRTPRTQDSAPKGFVPRTQVGTSTQRRDQKNNGKKEGPSNLQPKDVVVDRRRTIEVKQTSEEELVHIRQVTEEESENEIDTVVEDNWQRWKPSLAAEISQLTGSRRVRPVHKGLTEINEETEVARRSDVENRLSKTSFEDQIFNALRNNVPKRTHC